MTHYRILMDLEHVIYFQTKKPVYCYVDSEGIICVNVGGTVFEFDNIILVEKFQQSFMMTKWQKIFDSTEAE